MTSIFKPAQRLKAVKVSPILELSRRASELRAQGRDVIDLTVGEPNFETPEHIRIAAAEAMAQGKTKYTPLVGTADLISAIAAKTLRDTGINAEMEGIIACAGAKQVIYNALAATLDEGDEVILSQPCWASYADMVRIQGGVAILAPGKLDISLGWRIDIAAIEAAITKRTRWVLINSPSNPTGSVISKNELEMLAAVLQRHPDVWVIADEIYSQIVYDGIVAPSLTAVAPAMASRTLIVSGVSKAYAMTGWRLGWGVGPPELIKAMVAVQSQATSAPSSISQAAAVAALNGPQSDVEIMRIQFERRRNLLLERLSPSPKLVSHKPQGAFYLFPSLAGQADDHAVCRLLLEKADVAVVPGSEFGSPGSIRISFALAENGLLEAADRIVQTLDRA